MPSEPAIFVDALSPIGIDHFLLNYSYLSTQLNQCHEISTKPHGRINLTIGYDSSNIFSSYQASECLEASLVMHAFVLKF